jgi:alpha-tubulin suppressor-like RCC1 family protein
MLGIDNIGQVWGWGYNNYGQLGNNSTIDQCTPVSIQGAKKTFCRIGSFGESTIGIDNHGQIWGWGYNNYGQLGNNSIINQCTPVSIHGAKKTFCKISQGWNHDIVIDNHGQVWGWGYNYHGELGNNITTYTPLKVSFI